MRAFDRAMKDVSAEVETKTQAEQFFTAMDECEQPTFLIGFRCTRATFIKVRCSLVIVQMAIKWSCCSALLTKHSTA